MWASLRLRSGQALARSIGTGGFKPTPTSVANLRLQIAQGRIKIRHPKWQMYFGKVAAELIHA
jgi:hypothetical protein